MSSDYLWPVSDDRKPQRLQLTYGVHAMKVKMSICFGVIIPTEGGNLELWELVKDLVFVAQTGKTHTKFRSIS